MKPKLSDKALIDLIPLNKKLNWVIKKSKNNIGFILQVNGVFNSIVQHYSDEIIRHFYGKKK